MYRNHLESHGKDSENLHGCNICGKSFSVPARLTRHYRTHTGEKPYQCEYCKKSFSVKENLSVHRRIHTKERPYKCDVCDSAFEHSGKLHRHMRIHTGERPHKCSVCNKMFIQSGQLVIHMRTHTGEKPYICKTCGKGFTCSKQLKVHSRTHTGEKPYKCDICYKSFGYNHVLKLHQVSHYGEKCYKCSICHETFNSKKLIEYHIKTHSNSFFCNSTKSTESIFKTQNINNILLYNSNVGTNDMNMLIIENKNDNEIANIAKTIIKLENKSTNGSLNYFLCDSLHYQHHTNKNSKKVSQVITDQAYLTVNKNILFSKNLNTSNMEVEYPLEIEDRRQISIQQGLHSYADSNNCFTYKICDNEYVSNAHFSNFCLASGCLRRNINTNSLTQDAQCTQSSKASNTLELNIPYVKDNVRLPPRKRCKMILELMESKKPELTDPTICNTVIKFAKADNVNMSNG